MSVRDQSTSGSAEPAVINERAAKDELAAINKQVHRGEAARTAAPPALIGDRNMNPESLSLWQLIREDFVVHDCDWASQGFLALAIHRFGNWRMAQPKWMRLVLTPMYRCMDKACQVFCGIMLPYCVPVGRRVKLEHFGGMILSARQIGNDVTIRQNTTFGIASKADLNAKPTIEDGVDIGCNAVIVGNITVGRGSVIGAGAVVIRDVPPYSVVAGVPAKVIRTLRDDERTDS
jgi:serine O-acetyltransferase